MTTFHRDLIGDDILDIGSSKWSLSDKYGEDYRADIQGAPSSFMVPDVANVRSFYGKLISSVAPTVP